MEDYYTHNLHDDILRYLRDKGSSTQSEIENEYTGFHNHEALIACREMVDEGYLSQNPNRTKFYITGKGKAFFYEGGYKKRIEKDKMREAYTDQLQASTLATNESVRQTNIATLSNFSIQKKLTTASIIVAGASALFALGSIFVSLILSDKQTPQILQKQSQTLDSIVKSQKEINSTLKKIATSLDTSRVRHLR